MRCQPGGGGCHYSCHAASSPGLNAPLSCHSSRFMTAVGVGSVPGYKEEEVVWLGSSKALLVITAVMYGLSHFITPVYAHLQPRLHCFLMDSISLVKNLKDGVNLKSVY